MERGSLVDKVRRSKVLELVQKEYNRLGNDQVMANCGKLLGMDVRDKEE
jgi:hypothetical protein